MRITEIITPLVLAALVAVGTPAASVARPLDGARPTRAQAERCFQLNQAVPGTARGRHRVPCDPAGAAELPVRPASVTTLHAEPAGTPWAALAFGIATGALLLSATALTVGHRRLSTQPPGSLRS
jgi:hypothetical protein